MSTIELYGITTLICVFLETNKHPNLMTPGHPMNTDLEAVAKIINLNFKKLANLKKEIFQHLSFFVKFDLFLLKYFGLPKHTSPCEIKTTILHTL